MTNTSIQQFDFNNQQVRVLADEQGEPWFVAKDVCEILGTDTRDVGKILDEDEKGVDTIHTLGGRQQMTTVSEAGLYKLIMRSRKDNAKPFQRWVTHEVLPSIRKHGGYMSGQEELTPDQLVLKSIEYLQSKIAEQQAQLEQQAPKVLFADAYSASKKCVLVGELAKMLTQNGYKTGQNRLFKQLREEGYLMKKNGNPNFPTQRSMELQLFEVKASTITKPDGNEVSKFTTKVTPKGQAYFINRYTGNAPTLDIEG